VPSPAFDVVLRPVGRVSIPFDRDLSGSFGLCQTRRSPSRAYRADRRRCMSRPCSSHRSGLRPIRSHAPRSRRRVSLRSARCLHRAPSTGFSKTAPPSTSRPESLQLASRLASVRRSQAPHMDRPRGFSPPRRITPPDVRGLVASRYRPWGSPGFRPAVPRAVVDLGFLTDASPSRAFPSRAAVPASPRAYAPAPLPGCEPGRPRGLAPLVSPLHTRAVAGTRCPMLSWASLPETVRCRRMSRCAGSGPLPRARPRRAALAAGALRAPLHPARRRGVRSSP
jgi:hypothetical protein